MTGNPLVPWRPAGNMDLSEALTVAISSVGPMNSEPPRITKASLPSPVSLRETLLAICAFDVGTYREGVGSPLHKTIWPEDSDRNFLFLWATSSSLPSKTMYSCSWWARSQKADLIVSYNDRLRRKSFWASKHISGESVVRQPDRWLYDQSSVIYENDVFLSLLEEEDRGKDQYVPDAKVLSGLGRIVVDDGIDEFARRIRSYGSERGETRKLLARSVSTVVYGVVGQIADKAMVEAGGSQIALSDGTSFSIEFERALLRSLPIRPSLSGAFIGALHADLWTFIEKGGRLDGPWGRVDVEEGAGLTIRPRSEASSYLDSLESRSRAG